MAKTEAAAALTETHRLAQLRLRARTITRSLMIWRAVDIEDLENTWPPVEQALVALVSADARDSAALAAAYYDGYRILEGIGGRSTPRLAEIDLREVTGSLRYMGLFRTEMLKRAGRPDVADVGAVNVSGDASRHVLNAGRDTITESVAADPKALGWARVTDGSPCSFCRMLAGRGPVYRGKGGGFKAHVHCGCSAQPVYSKDEPWPGRASEWNQEWKKVTAGKSGAEARLAYRQHVEGRTAATAGA